MNHRTESTQKKKHVRTKISQSQNVLGYAMVNTKLSNENDVIIHLSKHQN